MPVQNFAVIKKVCDGTESALSGLFALRSLLRIADEQYFSEEGLLEGVGELVSSVARDVQSRLEFIRDEAQRGEQSSASEGMLSDEAISSEASHEQA